MDFGSFDLSYFLHKAFYGIVIVAAIVHIIYLIRRTYRIRKATNPIYEQKLQMLEAINEAKKTPPKTEYVTIINKYELSGVGGRRNYAMVFEFQDGVHRQLYVDANTFFNNQLNERGLLTYHELNGVYVFAGYRREI